MQDGSVDCSVSGVKSDHEVSVMIAGQMKKEVSKEIEQEYKLVKEVKEARGKEILSNVAN